MQLLKKIVLTLIFIASFNKNFAQWNTNTAINLEVAALPAADMHSITTSTGKTWVAFYHENAGNYDMRAQLLDANGIKLLGPNGALVSNKPSGSATFVFNICLDEQDNLIIAFQDERTGSSTSAVVYKISQSGTQLWGADGIVLGTGLAPYPGLLSNNEVVVAWNDASSNTLKLQKITTLGALAWTNPISVTVGSSLTTRGQVIPNTAGTFNLIFQKKGFGISTTLYSQRYTSSGTAIWSAPLQISTETTAAVRYYSAKAQNDTTYCGYYSSVGSRFNSWLQRINPDGSIPYGPNGSNFSTNTNSGDPYQQQTAIAFEPNSPNVWSVCTYSNISQSQNGVYIQKFLKADGSRLLGSTAQVVYPISAAYDSQAGELSLANDEPFFMSYDATYKIYATRLNANGNFVWAGNRLEISSTTATLGSPKGRYGFTGLSNNQAVGVWYENRGVEYRSYAQNITPGGLFGLDVATQGNVAAEINTNGGNLQMTSIIFPNTANQAVTWSIVSASGTASISSSGLVAALSNGTVWAKAVSIQDPTVADSLQITITNQSSTAITSVSVTTQGNIPASITTNGGSLQMLATVIPSTASQSVVWNIVPVSGTATINSNGLVTAQTNGTVWARAVAVSNPLIRDSMLITISNQTVQVSALIVSTLGSIPPTITTVGGSLQMIATITPTNATNQSVIWSVVPVTGAATINSNGLVTAQTNGTVWAKAISVSNPVVKDSMLITLSNQLIPVISIVVSTQGTVPATITTVGGSLQMIATITPTNATNQSVTWSIVPVTGAATINSNGLVTAQGNGTVWAKAISVSNNLLKDSMLITISGQLIPVTGIQVVTQNGVPAIINTAGSSLQLLAIITPTNATNQSVIWSIVPVTGAATINSNGLVTAQANGTVWAKAISVSNNLLKDSLLITITGQDANQQLSQMVLYPNPTISLLHLRLLQNHPAMTMSVINAAGQIISEELIAANELKVERILKLDKLNAGLYILSFIGINVEAQFKFIKQ